MYIYLKNNSFNGMDPILPFSCCLDYSSVETTNKINFKGDIDKARLLYLGQLAAAFRRRGPAIPGRLGAEEDRD